jgi:hypothetical protein
MCAANRGAATRQLSTVNNCKSCAGGMPRRGLGIMPGPVLSSTTGAVKALKFWSGYTIHMAIFIVRGRRRKAQMKNEEVMVFAFVFLVFCGQIIPWGHWEYSATSFVAMLWPFFGVPPNKPLPGMRFFIISNSNVGNKNMRLRGTDHYNCTPIFQALS